MIRVGNIKVPLDFDFNDLEGFCSRKFGIYGNNLIKVRLAKKSVDARKKSDVHFIISLDIEARDEKRLQRSLKNAVPVNEFRYKINNVPPLLNKPPLIERFKAIKKGSKMTDNNVAERVKKIIVEHLGVEADKVQDGASFIDDLGADSLDTVELVMAFEEEFGCSIPDDAAEKIRTVKDAIDFIEKQA